MKTAADKKAQDKNGNQSETDQNVENKDKKNKRTEADPNGEAKPPKKKKQDKKGAASQAQKANTVTPAGPSGAASVTQSQQLNLSNTSITTAANEEEGELSWLQFFSQNEIEHAITESKKPIVNLTKQELQKLEKQENAGESDSEPSCDNYDEKELAERFEAAISDDEVDDEEDDEKAKGKKDEEADRLKHDLQQQQLQSAAMARKEQ